MDWAIARSGIPTASEADNLLTPLFKARDGKMVETYLCAKLSEKWLGGPLLGFNTFDTEQGNIIEEEARPWLACELEQEIEQVGLCLTDDSRVGASPDGVIRAGPWVGVEIKSPQPTNHVRWLIDGVLPPEFRVQVHVGMYVTGATEWVFLSYRRNFPKLVVRIRRDEEIQEKIHGALETFLTDLDVAYERLCEINGGPPRRYSRPEPFPAGDGFVSDPNDVPCP